jgi:hypothetical protein
LVKSTIDEDIKEIESECDFSPELEKFSIIQPLSKMGKEINVKIDILNIK